MSRMTGASRPHGHGGHFSAAPGAQPYRQNTPHQGGHFPAPTGAQPYRQNTPHHGGHYSAATRAQPYRQNTPHHGGHSAAARGPPAQPYYNDPVCKICSSHNSTIRHVHASTEYDRRCAVNAGKSSFYCISCGRVHDTAKPTRRRLLITSSTLYRFDKAPGW